MLGLLAKRAPAPDHRNVTWNFSLSRNLPTIVKATAPLVYIWMIIVDPVFIEEAIRRVDQSDLGAVCTFFHYPMTIKPH